jgi:hypothetical protein
MSGRGHIVDDRDQSVGKTAPPNFAMRAHFGRPSVEIPSHPVAECLGQPGAVASGSTYNEIDCQLSLVLEPLRTAVTGREAVLDMLHGVLSAGLYVPAGPNAPRPPILRSSVETDSILHMSREWRYSLRSLILERLEQSVYEGELPEDTDIEVLSCLCMSFASGLAASLQDGISAVSLANSVALFVGTVGFHRVRAPKRRPRNSPSVVPPVFTLVKREPVVKQTCCHVQELHASPVP